MTQEWDVAQARNTYAISNWGAGFFDIDEHGHVMVFPKKDPALGSIDLYELAQKLRHPGFSFPILVRFTDILCQRVQHLRDAFAQASEDHDYKGAYTPVYPIKVNQQRTVIEAIMGETQRGAGLEAGSKPELLAILALARNNVVICNGYKDSAYIRLALIGVILGLDTYIVIEKPSEVKLILAESQALGVKPRLGVRVRLASISAGMWQNTGGEKSKFGLAPNDLLTVIDSLRNSGYLDNLTMLHFHVGSQIANIHDIKTAVKEAARHYAELHRLGVRIDYVDAGGGLGVDYEGSGSRNFCSMNYTIEDYANAVVSGFKHVCEQAQLPHPHIATEAGRAMSAHHAVLITNVVDVETVSRHGHSQQSDDTDLLRPCDSNTSILEIYHNAHYEISEKRSMYLQGKTRLPDLAQANDKYEKICLAIRDQLDINIRAHRDLLDELNERLADKVFCNFSVFQSMPDVWAIQQIFPLMPIHRLEQEPTQRAVIQDLTCDSDGRIDNYIDGQSIENTVPLHTWRSDQEYLVGFFLVGAYQEILGDMHNLFGDTHSINVEVDDKGGHRFVEPVWGDGVGDLLNYVHLDPARLKATFKFKLNKAALSSEQHLAFEEFFSESLSAYTYLEI